MSVLRGAAGTSIQVFGACPSRRFDTARASFGFDPSQRHPDLETAIENYASFLAENVDLDRLTRLQSSDGHARLMQPLYPCPLLNALLAVMLPFLSHILICSKPGAMRERILPFSPLADEAVPQADCLAPGRYLN